jgi:DNA-binding CsgD family transcriptional regulator
MALLALSHTQIEQRLYLAMLSEINGSDGPQLFTGKRLMQLTGISNLSTIRRGIDGLVAKLSIEKETKGNGNGHREHGTAYRVYSPQQIIARRRQIGSTRGSIGIETSSLNQPFEKAISRVVANRNLSRREAQVALCCVEGLTNAEIGNRLEVSEQTVKFHLRHVFIKFGVKRRAELISRLLM